MNRERLRHEEILFISLLCLAALYAAVVYGLPAFSDWLSRTLTTRSVLWTLAWAFLFAAVGAVLTRAIAGYASPKLPRGSIYVGADRKGAFRRREIHLTPDQRAHHVHILGSTGAGKTKSLILPWTRQDMKNGYGVLLMDAKGEWEFIRALALTAHATGRMRDFHLFTLTYPELSATYNPLVGDDPQKIAERVFSSWVGVADAVTGAEFYKSVQFRIFSSLVGVLHSGKKRFNFIDIYTCLNSDAVVQLVISQVPESPYRDTLVSWMQQSRKERDQYLAGLKNKIYPLAVGRTAHLINDYEPDIRMDRLLKRGDIAYFQLPAMKYEELAVAIGKTALQDFQSAVSERHTDLGIEERPWFWLTVDEFSTFVYPGFAHVLNKARSAKIGVTIAHQSMGDLDTSTVPRGFRSAVIDNCGTHIMLRTNDPPTAELLAEMAGTMDTLPVEQLPFWRRMGSGISPSLYVPKQGFNAHPNLIKVLPPGRAVALVKANRKVPGVYTHVHLPLFRPPPPGNGLPADRKAAVNLDGFARDLLLKRIAEMREREPAEVPGWYLAEGGAESGEKKRGAGQSGGSKARRGPGRPRKDKEAQ